MQVASESDGSKSTALDTFGNCFALGTLVRHPYQLSILLCLSLFFCLYHGRLTADLKMHPMNAQGLWTYYKWLLLASYSEQTLWM